MNAVLMAVLMVAIPDYRDLGSLYVLYRTGWHLVGLMLGMAVERLFWFTPLLQRLERSESALIARLQDLLNQEPAQRAPELINAYASSLRSIVLKSDRPPCSVQSQQRGMAGTGCAMASLGKRVPRQLASIDADGCRNALLQLASSGGIA